MNADERVGTPHVLIIEDEADLLEVLEIAFENAGYRVATAANGVTGWQHFAREHPDLVVLDLNMPEMSGFRLLQLIRSESLVPVLILTAYDFAEAEEVANYRPNYFMNKPFDALDLIAQANCLIGRATNGRPCA
jgi:two-component system, OmpR family, response regulator